MRRLFLAAVREDKNSSLFIIYKNRKKSIRNRGGTDFAAEKTGSEGCICRLHKKKPFFFTKKGMFFPANPLEKYREWCYHLYERDMRARHINIPNRNRNIF